MTECPFCRIVAGRAPADIFYEDPGHIVIVPLNPVTDGHLLVIPRVHVPDAKADPDVTASTMRVAAQMIDGDTNLITSVGPAATQTVHHLHVHVVPRYPGDGLALPWTH